MPKNRKQIDQKGTKQGKKPSATQTRYKNLKPEYVEYILRMAIDLDNANRIANMMIIKNEDKSNYPVVVTDAYVPKTAMGAINVTIKGTVYTSPKDFDYDYTFHSELNEVAGNGFDMIKETLHFKNLPGHPTLTGLAELKSLDVIYSPTADLSHAENIGNYQLVGTGMFKNVKGSGIAMFGRSTGHVVYHIAWIKGWPL